MLGLEGVGVLIAGFGMPEGAIRVVSIVAFAGFPVAIALTWLFQVNAAGVRATTAADMPEGRAELAAAEHHSLLDGRTLLVAGGRPTARPHLDRSAGHVLSR